MRAGTITICLWPGLSELWFRGKWVALLQALGFGIFLNVLLASSFVWPGFIPWWVNLTGWLMLAVGWACSVIFSWRDKRKDERSPEKDSRGLFIRAQDEYLKGHWKEAQRLAVELLTYSESDVDAQLLLVSIHRRNRRLAQAQKCLRRLQQTDGGLEKWRWEIDQEYRILEQLTDSAREGSQPDRVGPSKG